MPYSAREYWTELHDRDDTSAVGQSTLPAEINHWLYRILARNIRSFVRRHGLLDPAPDSVFEIGSGRGDWIPFWRDLGAARVDGCDLVPAAVERLTGRFGSTGTFFVADISDDSWPPPMERNGYPLVTVFNVLLHVTDDERFVTALDHVAGLVAPGGHLLLIEPMLRDRRYVRAYDPAASSRARLIDAYEAPLLAAGLERVEVRAAVVLGNNPIEAGSRPALRRYQRLWGWVAGTTRKNPRSARWIGPLLAVGDRIAMLGSSAPSSKIALFRRPA